MCGRPRIGVAFPHPCECAAIVEWCESGNFQPVPLTDTPSIIHELDRLAFEALIIDADLAVSDDTPYVLRTLGRNRPLIIISDPGVSPVMDLGRRDATYLARPLTRDVLLLAITLALAEGRPARCSPRRLVARLPATVESVPARLIDVSYEGIRLELPERHRSSLPPLFSVRVPMFNVNVVGKRVWVHSALDSSAGTAFWCGVRLDHNPDRAVSAWQTLVDNAPASTSLSSDSFNYL